MMPLTSSVVRSTVSRIIPSIACSIWFPLGTTTLAGTLGETAGNQSNAFRIQSATTSIGTIANTV